MSLRLDDIYTEQEINEMKGLPTCGCNKNTSRHIHFKGKIIIVEFLENYLLKRNEQ